MEDKPEWMKPSFVEAIQGSRFRKKELYIGEDEEDITDDLDISDVIKCRMTLVTPIAIRWQISLGRSTNRAKNPCVEHY